MEKRICYICKNRVNISSPETGGQGEDKDGVYHLSCLTFKVEP